MTPGSWLIDRIAERLGQDIEEDRILLIPGRDDQIGYVDTESCEVYLITVELARLVPSVGPDTLGTKHKPK